MGIFWPNTTDDCYSSISVNTGLGLSFLRIVNEDGSNGWAQVYARIPFDNTELLSKGALFGVIMGKNKENWAEKDAEQMSWVEEYFNKIESEGELATFFLEWRAKYPDLDGVWVWIMDREGKRVMMMVRWGETGITLLRKGKEFNFSKNMIEGKVAKGQTLEGDRLIVWTDGLSEKSEEKRLADLDEPGALALNEKLKQEGFAGAGLVLDFDKFVKEKVEEPEIELLPARIEIEAELVNEKYVGPIRWKEKLANWWFSNLTKFRRPIRQEGEVEWKENSKRKKWAVTLGVVFLVILFISLVTGSIKIRREAGLKKWKEFSEPIEKSLSEAVGLVQLNPSGAKKLVEDARVTYGIKNSEFSKGNHAKELVDLGKKIEVTWTLISGEKESQVEEVARIDLVRQGFKGGRMHLIKDKQLVVLDEGMGVVVTIELSAKDIKVAAGKGEGLGWSDAIGDNSLMMVLNGSGVRNAINGQDLIKFDAAVVKPVAFDRFGGNVYILDQGNKEIFKYAAIGDGFGERSRWLKQDQSMSFEPVDMAIDSDIWVVSAEGEVEKFRRGSKEQFAISGLTAGMKISRMAIEIDGDKMALLDSVSGAVAVCSKTTGACSQLLKSEKLREVKDIEFDTQGNLLVLLPGVVGVLK